MTDRTRARRKKTDQPEQLWSLQSDSAQAETGVPPIVYEVLQASGQPLDAETRALMEPRFGHDFSQVRVHTDGRAAESAQTVNAVAYTVGQNVVFGTSEYSTANATGRQLLAHELTHVVQQSGNLPANKDIEEIQVHHAETQAEQATQRVLTTGSQVASISHLNASHYLQKQQIGAKVAHPSGQHSPYQHISADFDGREFVVRGDGRQLLRVEGQSGRPYSVRPVDAATCHGSTEDSYLNNPRYVGIEDNGPIPEGEYQFTVTQMSTFSLLEQAQMMTGGHYTDPFGQSLHGGDWGAGRVPLSKILVLPSRFGGNTANRSGFYLHGGIMPGSSGCIDIGNSGFKDLVPLLLGYHKPIVVRVRYTQAPPGVGPVDRALGRFTYPPQENPTLIDRVRSLIGL